MTTFDLINGLPLHPLVVHGVVVLLPLAVLGTIAIALRPGWRLSYGVLVVACAAVAAKRRRRAHEAGDAAAAGLISRAHEPPGGVSPPSGTTGPTEVGWLGSPHVTYAAADGGS